MDFIKKMWKEISVFGIVLVIFLGLFVYRHLTYATYKTISSTKLESKLKDKDSFILVAGASNDNNTVAYQSILTDYATKNRKETIYYLDTKSLKDNYISKTLKVNVSTPCTFIIKDGKVKANKQGSLQYYYLSDFIKENQ